MSWARLDNKGELRNLEHEQAEWLAAARADAHRRVDVEHDALRTSNDARAAAADIDDPLPAGFPAVREQIERESQERSHGAVDAAFDELAELAAMHLEVLRREVHGVAVH